MAEQLITVPDVDVADAEYRRLLGYPRDHEPSPRAQELAAWARQWFKTHGRPWIYLREAELNVSGDWLRFDGRDFPSPQLRAHLSGARAARAVFLAVSAGAACEEQARTLWLEAKPDEYFFLETYGSAVVEHLVATANSRVCAQAESTGLSAVPHYSPGYGGWDVAEQNALFELIRDGASQAFPEPLEVLGSGMLRPKKSLLGLIGLAPAAAGARPAMPLVPCANCSFSPCQYRRMPYRHARDSAQSRSASSVAALNGRHGDTLPARAERAPLTQNANYTLNRRALQKWSQERVQFERADDASLVARFRFDGTTCSNMGRPLAFDYRVVLGPPETSYRILRADCEPSAGDDGYRFMCEYQRDPDGLMAAITTETPLVGRPLDDVLTWERRAAPNGCYCDADSRAHKWGLALEAIHYALVNREAEPALANLQSPPVE